MLSEELESPVLDGVKVNRYACSNEWNETTPCGIGTFVHEFGHVLGLPDLYSTSYTGAFTPGEWSCMDMGPYNNDGRTPPRFSAFERYALGWIKPVRIDKSRNVVLPDISHNKAALLTTSNEYEYFLIENRQQEGWDRFIPGHGMLVWHIDYDPAVWTDNRVNNLPYHQYVDLIEADGEASYNNISGDAFPGTSNVTSFTDRTTPAMKTWNGISLPFPITEITEKDRIIRFKVLDGGYPLPVAETMSAQDVRADSFIAYWNPVEGTYNYLLTVEEKTNDANWTILPSTHYRDTGFTNSYMVEGLEPGRCYRYKVIVTDGLDYSAESTPMEVSTGEYTLEYFAAVASEAEEIGTDSFIACWEPMENATEYFLNVYIKKKEGSITDGLDFTTGADDLPEGWHSTSAQTYSMASYCGESAPSLRFTQNHDYIESPVYTDAVKSLSFWHRGNSTSSDDILEVEIKKASGWESFSTLPVISAKGGEIREFEFPAGVEAVRIAYRRAGDKGSVAIDDIKVGYGSLLVPAYLPGYEDFVAGNTLRAKIENLLPANEYFYTVVASDGKHRTQKSMEISVVTLKESGITTESPETQGLVIRGSYVMTDDDTNIEIYDSTGLLLVSGKGEVRVPDRGLRIVKVTEKGIAIKRNF